MLFKEGFVRPAKKKVNNERVFTLHVASATVSASQLVETVQAFLKPDRDLVDRETSEVQFSLFHKIFCPSFGRCCCSILHAN